MSYLSFAMYFSITIISILILHLCIEIYRFIRLWLDDEQDDYLMLTNIYIFGATKENSSDYLYFRGLVITTIIVSSLTLLLFFAAPFIWPVIIFIMYLFIEKERRTRKRNAKNRSEN